MTDTAPEKTVSDLARGDRIALADGVGVVTAILQGDHSPFGKSGMGRFYHPNPVTVRWRNLDGTFGLQVCAPDDVVAALMPT